MGVPGFFLWLMKKYKKDKIVNRIDFYKDKKFKWLCLDANCLIHPKCYEVLNENPNFKDKNILERKMINRCLEYIEKLYCLINPEEGLYIAIDGVAPVGKIKQQRSRRFKSINDKNMIDRLKEKHNVEKTNFWNSASITPGTDFMMKLTAEITNWAKKQKYTIIFSSGNTPSEGEHKILDFIRRREMKSQEGPYVIYGLDADLIFLSLALQRNDLYLMREDNHLNKGGDEILILVDTEKMKISVSDTMLTYLDDIIKKPTNKELINDFIFICYFLGNDFLPHHPSVNIYGDGLDLLLKTYGDMLKDTILPIIKIDNESKRVKFNQKSLIVFIRKMAEQEDDILVRHSKHEPKRFPLTGSDYERELKRIEMLRFRIDDPVKLGEGSFDEYSGRYYDYYFHGKSNETIVKICYEYLKCLVWVSNYYFFKVPSWDYYYPYDHVPFLKDISKVISLIDLSTLKFKLGEPLKPLEQLLCVLPPQSSDLVPNVLRNLYNESSKLGHLYPLSFKQDLINKKKFWQGIPLLPFLEINLVKSEFSKKEKSLKKNDKLKNEILSEFEFKN